MENNKSRVLLGYICTFIVIAIMIWAVCIPDPTTNAYRKSNSLAQKYKIGVSMPAKHLERWNHDGAMLKKLLEKEGFDVELLFADNNALQQNNDIQNLVANGADLLLIAAVDADSLSFQIDEAVKKGVKVIAYNRPISNTAGISYLVTEDCFSCGAEMGKFLEKSLNLTNNDNKTYNMEILGGDPADKCALIYYDGQMSVLKKYLDAGKLIIPSGQITFEQTCTNGWSTELGQKRLQNLLSSYYTNQKIDAVLAAFDGLGIAAMKTLETDYRGGNTVYVTGQDGEDPALKMIVDGKSIMTIYKNIESNAVVAVELVKSLFQSNNQLNPEKLCESFSFKCSFDDKNFDNGKKIVPTFMVGCETITKDNYKEKLVDTGLFKIGANGYLEKINR